MHTLGWFVAVGAVVLTRINKIKSQFSFFFLSSCFQYEGPAKTSVTNLQGPPRLILCRCPAMGSILGVTRVLRLSKRIGTVDTLKRNRNKRVSFYRGSKEYTELPNSHKTNNHTPGQVNALEPTWQADPFFCLVYVTIRFLHVPH